MATPIECASTVTRLSQIAEYDPHIVLIVDVVNRQISEQLTCQTRCVQEQLEFAGENGNILYLSVVQWRSTMKNSAAKCEFLPVFLLSVSWQSIGAPRNAEGQLSFERRKKTAYSSRQHAIDEW